jgi:uncharacterized DUF497 family protein
MRFEWDPQKNELLKSTRDISFEAIVVHLALGDLWRVADHPDQARYPEQRLFFVVVDEYVHIVPYEERGKVIWLITIIPSRKATRDYLEEKNETD